MIHLRTSSYAVHKATDNFDDMIGGILDKFMEILVGTYGIKPNITELRVNRDHLNEATINDLYLYAREYVMSFGNLNLNSDLLNIRDELLGELNKMLYLLRLK
jgi:hypothetical protein